MQVQCIDVMNGLQERCVEGIHDRGWVFVSEGVRKNRQYIRGRLFRLMADTLEALFRLISPIH